MRKVIFTLFSLVLSVSALASHQKVTLTDAGMLSVSILPEWRQNLDSITISGPVNGADMQTIRDLVGGEAEVYDYYPTNPGKVFYLDIKDVTLVVDDVVYVNYYWAMTGKIEKDGLGDMAFYMCKSLEEVSLPSGVKNLGYATFMNCPSLKKVTFNSDVETIENYALSSGSEYIEEITIPASVKSIGEKALGGNPNLKKAVLSRHLTELPNRLFENNYAMTHVLIPSTDLTKIGNNAFQNCESLTELSIAAAKAPALGTEVFAASNTNRSDVNKTTCVLKVPQGTSNTSYASADEWKDFVNVQAYDASEEPFAPRLTLSSSTPANGAELSGTFSVSFNLVFGESVTAVSDMIKQVRFLEGGTEVKLSDYTWTASAISGGVRLYLDYYSVMTGSVKIQNDTDYQLVIPAGAFKNAEGIMNEEIILTFHGPSTPPTPVALSSSTPADGSTLTLNAAGKFPVSFDLDFGESVTVVSDKKTGIKFYQGDETTGEEVNVYYWYDETKTVDEKPILRLSACDFNYDYISIFLEKDTKYTLVLPEGLFTNATGGTNEKIVLTFNELEEPVVTLTLVSSTPADGAALEAKSQNAEFSLTFDKGINKTSASGIKLYIDEIGGATVTPPYGWSISQPTAGSSTVKIFAWASDYMSSFKYTPEEGKKYILVVPAGNFKTPDGEENEEIVLTFNDTTSTGIKTIDNTNDTTVSDVYTINGQKVIGTRKGVNVIRFSDGTTRKVIVK